MSKPKHPSSREVRRKAIGDLYSPEARESDGKLAVLRAEHLEASGLFFKGRTQKRSVTRKNRPGYLTEHTEAIREDVDRTREKGRV